MKPKKYIACINGNMVNVATEDEFIYFTDSPYDLGYSDGDILYILCNIKDNDGKVIGNNFKAYVVVSNKFELLENETNAVFDIASDGSIQKFTVEAVRNAIRERDEK